ncbi:MAG: hypothetical protein ABIJ26_02785 [Candidatus Margulisiibacteriota bacterium]|nr:hypothetical protein [Candidatus Margulisiibacteriota bacterium]
MSKKVSRTAPRTVRGTTTTAPAGLHPVIQRFFKFTRDTARKFSKNLKNPEESENELIKAVDQDFKKRR